LRKAEGNITGNCVNDGSEYGGSKQDKKDQQQPQLQCQWQGQEGKRGGG